MKISLGFCKWLFGLVVSVPCYLCHEASSSNLAATFCLKTSVSNLDTYNYSDSDQARTSLGIKGKKITRTGN